MSKNVKSRTKKIFVKGSWVLKFRIVICLLLTISIPTFARGSMGVRSCSFRSSFSSRPSSIKTTTRAISKPSSKISVQKTTAKPIKRVSISNTRTIPIINRKECYDTTALPK